MTIACTEIRADANIFMIRRKDVLTTFHTAACHIQLWGFRAFRGGSGNHGVPSKQEALLLLRDLDKTLAEPSRPHASTLRHRLPLSWHLCVSELRNDGRDCARCRQEGGGGRGFRYSRGTQISRLSRAAGSDIRCTEFTHPAVHANEYHIYIYIFINTWKSKGQKFPCVGLDMYSKTFSA